MDSNGEDSESVASCSDIDDENNDKDLNMQ